MDGGPQMRAGARRSPTVLSIALGVSALSLAACGDDDRAPPPAPGSDGGGADSGNPPDASDASPAEDGGLLDAGSAPRDGGLTGCTFGGAESVFKLGTDRVSEGRTVPVAAFAGGFAVVWAETPLASRDVFGQIIPAAGAPPTRVPITNDAAISEDPVIATVDDGFLAAWYDNSAGGFEIFALDLNADLAPAGTPQRLTNNSNRDDAPALLLRDTEVLAAWVEDDMVMGTRSGWSRRLDLTGAPLAPAVSLTSPPEAVSRPSLVPREEGSLAVWADSGSSDMALLKLDTAGAPVGSSSTLSTESNVAGSGDVVLSAEGGAAVFDILAGGTRPELRFRALDAAGDPSGIEQILTITPETARGVSLDRFGGGWVIAYRALSDSDISEPTLRIAFVSVEGQRLGHLNLTPVNEDGGRTSVRVSPDGTAMLVTWADLESTETIINAARVRCD